MDRKTRKSDRDSLLPGNLSGEALDRARHAAEFPPNTPHSVINAFYGKDHDTLSVEPGADPRDLKAGRTPLGIDVVETSPGEAPSGKAGEALEQPKRKSRSRKSRKAKSETSETATETEAQKV